MKSLEELRAYCKTLPLPVGKIRDTDLSSYLFWKNKARYDKSSGSCVILASYLSNGKTIIPNYDLCKHYLFKSYIYFIDEQPDRRNQADTIVHELATIGKLSEEEVLEIGWLKHVHPLPSIGIPWHKAYDVKRKKFNP